MAKRNIPLSVPNLCGRELEYVSDAISSGWVSTAGPYVSQFEEAFANYVHTPDAVACQSGTAGIHLALRAAGIQRDDAVVVPALTFIAAVNPVRYLDATPIFMDCDSSLCIDPGKLARFCEEECTFKGDVLIHERSNKPVRAIIVVHVFGNIADMISIMRIAEMYNLVVIEDATEALGTRYADGPFEGMFAGTLGDYGVYSFNGNKIITTGGGGMVVARDDRKLKQIKHLSTQAKSDTLYFEHDEIGYNYRLTNIQAALGLAQLEQIESFIEVKNSNYALYSRLIDEIEGIILLGFREGTRSNKWFYSVKCTNSGFSRDGIIEGLQGENIQARPIWGIICDQQPYRGSIEYEVSLARDFRRRIVNIPCSTDLTSEDIERVVKAIVGCRSNLA